MDVGRHPNIDLITLAEVISLKGKAGDFEVTIKCNPRYVDEDLCTGCGDCTMACPQVTRNEFDLGLAARKAIYRPYPQAVPSAYAIDIDVCLNSPTHFVCERCRRTCKRDAIDHDMQAKYRKLNIGSVIVATGFEEFHPHVMKSYGYGVWQNVMTSLEFERLLNASGPTAGHVIRPSDRKVPKNLVFIQCVGARGEGGRPNCSKYCCMNSVKDALLIKQHEPDVESCTILYTDIRAFGKGFDDFVNRANAEEYIHFMRGRPSKLMEIENDDIEIFVENTESLEQLRLKSDLVVLSCAGIPQPGADNLAALLGIDVNEIGFYKYNSLNTVVETSKKGIFLCGSASGPQIIPECVSQASAAASLASKYVLENKIPDPERLIPEPVDPKAEPRVGVFICKCGANIGRIVKTEELAEEAAKLPGVVYSGVELFSCADSGQNSLREKIVEHKLNRVVVAACTPRTHEPVFRNACLEAGLNPYLFEMANIRDQCTWVHSKERDKAHSKAFDLIRMSVARSVELKPLEMFEIEVNKKVLIIGGGIAGMRAALDLAEMNFEVALVEADPQLGGRVKSLHSLFPVTDSNPADLLIEKIENSNVETMLNSRVSGVSGFIGNFEVSFENGSINSTKAGAIVIATGTSLFEPGEKWGFNKGANVITSMQLEEYLSDKRNNHFLKTKKALFIQCVGSRDEEEGYRGCSRYCCPTSVKQALELNKLGIETTILYRDMRMVGAGMEEFYRQARDEGVLFLRYHKKDGLKFNGVKKVNSITYNDSILDKKITVDTDLIVLAVGMVDDIEKSETLRQMLKVPRGDDGFFLEKHPELGPVETAVDGVFICGTVQGPKDIKDSLAQATAAAGKVAELLSKEKLTMEPTVCEVNPDLCRACAKCVDICEYKAPAIDKTDGRAVAEINKALCKGCGTCAVWCPTNAITANHYSEKQIGAMIKALFEEYHA